MPMTTTYSDARAKLASFWNRLEQDRDLLVIERRGHETMAMLPLAEIEGLLESVHLLRSPANARRLLRALQRALGDEGTPRSLEQLREELGIGE